MKFRSCPRCHRNSLYSNGAFWACAVCGYAITESALVVDEGRSRRGPNAPFESSG